MPANPARPPTTCSDAFLNGTRTIGEAIATVRAVVDPGNPACRARLTCGDPLPRRQGAVALLHWFRRLRIRWEIRDDIHHAFVTLGCTVTCWRRLRTALRWQSSIRLGSGTADTQG
ncbi:hypothetical protein [Streptomyces violaceusniger]|uniref:Transposase n=1 Tax=Streptomyces violaceusniger TaxID=68280 RepID=A0A4D4L162_STRVO|nr:hypothetical protein SVIO_024120 [Streptomyces violaceusniger]